MKTILNFLCFVILLIIYFNANSAENEINFRQDNVFIGRTKGLGELNASSIKAGDANGLSLKDSNDITGVLISGDVTINKIVSAKKDLNIDANIIQTNGYISTSNTVDANGDINTNSSFLLDSFLMISNTGRDLALGIDTNTTLINGDVTVNKTLSSNGNINTDSSFLLDSFQMISNTGRDLSLGIDTNTTLINGDVTVNKTLNSTGNINTNGFLSFDNFQMISNSDRDLTLGIDTNTTLINGDVTVNKTLSSIGDINTNGSLLFDSFQMASNSGRDLIIGIDTNTTLINGDVTINKTLDVNKDLNIDGNVLFDGIKILSNNGPDLLVDSNLIVNNIVSTNILRILDADKSNVTSISQQNIFSDLVLSLPVDQGLSGQVLSTDGNGLTSWITGTAQGDNLGNHTATENLKMNGFNIVGGDSNNVFILDSNGVSIKSKKNRFISLDPNNFIQQEGNSIEIKSGYNKMSSLDPNVFILNDSNGIIINTGANKFLNLNSKTKVNTLGGNLYWGCARETYTLGSVASITLTCPTNKKAISCGFSTQQAAYVVSLFMSDNTCYSNSNATITSYTLYGMCCYL
jgi:phage baseplate assembly protein gpV